MSHRVVVVVGDRVSQALVRVEVDRRPPRALLETAEQRLERGDVEVLLRPEVLEDEPVGDARLLGDLVDRDVPVVAGEELFERDLQELLAPSQGPFACQRPPSQVAGESRWGRDAGVRWCRAEWTQSSCRESSRRSVPAGPGTAST